MLSKKDKAFISVARYLATKSKARNTHGAVIVKGGRVVGTGWNKGRNSPTIIDPERIKHDCSYHAEEVAIKEAGSNIKGAVIYVARVNRQGKDRDSQPCSKCSILIKEAGIKKVIYTSEKGINVYH